MSNSGVSIAKDCIEKYQNLQQKKQNKYLIYKLNDTNTEIVLEKEGTSDDWEEFRSALENAKSKAKNGKESPGPRYAVYDFSYELAGGEGSRSKVIFISWSPDTASIQPKMIYASSKESFKSSLSGIAIEIQANDLDDIEYDTVLKTVSKGRA